MTNPHGNCLVAGVEYTPKELHLKVYFGVALVSALALGCGGVEPSPGTPEELGTGPQAISSSFNGCTFTTSVPGRVAPSIYPEWNEDVRATGSIQCDTAGSYNVLHNLQIWNARWQSWDNYHFGDPTIYSLAAGTAMNFENRNWLEPFCYRTSMAIQKFDASRMLIWRSPTIYSAAVNLGQACPGS